MEKTIKEWLSELPGDLAAKALANHELKPMEIPAGTPISTLNDALNWAFPWSQTQEGGDFWSAVYSIAKNPAKLELETLRAENEALKARIAELEPKKEWWKQYKVGDKIDIIGVEVAEVDTDKDEPARIAINGYTGHDTNWLWVDDRSIRPHQP